MHKLKLRTRWKNDRGFAYIQLSTCLRVTRLFFSSVGIAVRRYGFYDCQDTHFCKENQSHITLSGNQAVHEHVPRKSSNLAVLASFSDGSLKCQDTWAANDGKHNSTLQPWTLSSTTSASRDRPLPVFLSPLPCPKRQAGVPRLATCLINRPSLVL